MQPTVRDHWQRVWVLIDAIEYMVEDLAQDSIDMPIADGETLEPLGKR